MIFNEAAEPAMPILNSDKIKSIPLAMMRLFADKIFLYYGRNVDRVASHRGLTVKEALEIIHNEGTMPPPGYYELALLGEVSLYLQSVRDGWKYGPHEDKPIDYSDCAPGTFINNLSHLCYMKAVESDAEVDNDRRPFLLFINLKKKKAFSFENGVKVDRTRDAFELNSAPKVMSLPVGNLFTFGSQPMDPVGQPLTVSPLGQLKQRAETLFDAIKHGDEDHQNWLKEAIRCHFASEPIPEYVAGKNKVGQKVAEFFNDLRSEQKPLDSEVGQILADNLDSLYEGEEVKNSSAYIHRPDEPFFVLLGRDPQAPEILEHWADVREFAEPGDWKIESARQTARDMRVFKAANPDFGMGQALYETAVCENLLKYGLDINEVSTQLQAEQEVTARTVPITELSFSSKLSTAMDTPVGQPNIELLAQVADSNPAALPLALQMVNAQTCPGCNFIHTHCRCNSSST